MRPYLKKTHHKKGLVEWLKVKALNSNPSTAKKKERKKRKLTVVVFLYIDLPSAATKKCNESDVIGCLLSICKYLTKRFYYFIFVHMREK
jgi:hypothetical protein